MEDEGPGSGCRSVSMTTESCLAGNLEGGRGLLSVKFIDSNRLARE